MVYSPQDILSVKLFEGLEGEARLKLFEVSKRVEFPVRHTILQEGDWSFNLYTILNGSVGIFKEIKGELKRIAVLTQGDCFGEMALFEGKSRSATVTTLETTTLLEFDKGHLDKLFQREPRIAAQVYYNLGRLLSARLRSS